MSDTAAALHMWDMTTLTNTHTRRRAVEHRITVMETPEDQHYYGRTYDNYPDQDGNVELSTGDYTSVKVPLMGLYLIEELDSKGQPTGTFDLLTFQKLNEQFEELGNPGLDYGVRAVGGSDVERHSGIGTARIHVGHLRLKRPLGKWEVISRSAGSDDEWAVVGR